MEGKLDQAAPDIRRSYSLTGSAFRSDNWRRSPSEFPRVAASAAPKDVVNTDYAATQRVPSRLNPTGQQAYPAFGSRKRSRLDAAAASRPQGANGRQRPTSTYMKQSCLPVSERDPDLLHAEQNKGRTLAREVYKPGMIIRAAIHEPFLAGATDITDKSRTGSIYGPIFSKVRKMIVVALYEDHYVAVPIFTHNGNGLQAKKSRDEYVSLSDHRSREPFTQSSKHLPLITESMNVGVDPIHPKATAHLTYPVSRKYDLHVIPEGMLDKMSVRRLIDLYNGAIPRAPQV